MSSAFNKGDRVRHKTGRGDIGYVVDIIPAEGAMLTTYKVQITKPIGLIEGTVYDFFGQHLELIDPAPEEPFRVSDFEGVDLGINPNDLPPVRMEQVSLIFAMLIVMNYDSEERREVMNTIMKIEKRKQAGG